ncbi:hypothetical protein IV203_024341 [Nitzschia inconspicua]|uniref:Uncharacterized protein n=1 Tax=Nitzschia inconspicua TaxID=303405 RepID=A0A9K3PAZ5_9STRA|nr:hypothetical protein IV203_024341 [Nitzschia inconspicua]
MPLTSTPYGNKSHRITSLLSDWAVRVSLWRTRLGSFEATASAASAAAGGGGGGQRGAEKNNCWHVPLPSPTPRLAVRATIDCECPNCPYIDPTSKKIPVEP